MNRNYLLGGAAVVAVAVGGALVLQRSTAPHSAKHVPPAATAPLPTGAGPSPAAAPAASPPCAPPADSPPAPPDGATATAEEMRQGHDLIQAYVKNLEAYQSCLVAYADHAGPRISAADRQNWIDQGNGAVDEANLLAKAFSVQIQAFKARSP